MLDLVTLVDLATLGKRRLATSSSSPSIIVLRLRSHIHMLYKNYCIYVANNNETEDTPLQNSTKYNAKYVLYTILRYIFPALRTKEDLPFHNHKTIIEKGEIERGLT